MPIYTIAAPNGKTYRIEGPPGASADDLFAALTAIVPEANIGRQSGVMSEAVFGAKQTARAPLTLLRTLADDPNKVALESIEATRRAREEAGEGVSLERLQRQWERGALPAAGQVLSDVPVAVSGQAANLAAMAAGAVGGAKLGALAGPAAPVAVPAGAALGAAATAFPGLYVENLQAQALAQQERGEPVDVSRTRAAVTAAAQSALEVGGTALALGGRAVKALLGPLFTQAAASSTAKAAAEKALVNQARTFLGSAARGAGRGAVVEPATELAQSVLTRAQAGQDLLSDDALSDYGDSIYQALLIGPTLGAAGNAATFRPPAAAPSAPEVPEAPAPGVAPPPAAAPGVAPELPTLESILPEELQRLNEDAAPVIEREAPPTAPAAEAVAEPTIRGREAAPAPTEPLTPETIITPEILAEAGVPVTPRTMLQKEVKSWFDENVTGKSFAAVQELAARSPGLIKGSDLQARALRDLLAATAPPAFQGAQVGQPDLSTVPVTAEPDVAADQRGVGVPGKPAGRRGRPGGVQPAAEPAALDVDGVAGLEQPAVQGDVPAVREPAALEAQEPLSFETAQGSTYTVDAEGNTTRTKRSPGRGRGTTYPAHPALFVEPEQADALSEARRANPGAHVRLGYVTPEGQLQPVTTTREIPQGARPVAAVLSPDNTQVLHASPAQRQPAVGLSPVEKLYTPDGMSSTHIGNPIVRVGAEARPEAGPETRQQLAPREEIPLSDEVIEALEQNNLSEALLILSEQVTSPFLQRLSERLSPLLLNTRVTISPDLRTDKGVPAAGGASTDGMRIWLDVNRGMNVETLLHESVHAASERILDMPDAQRTEPQRRAVQQLKSLYEAAKADSTITLEPEAREKLSEFVTEAMTNPQLVDQLRKKPWRLSDMWTGFKRTLLNMLGISDPKTMQDAVTASMDTLFSRPMQGKATMLFSQGRPVERAAKRVPQTETPAFKRWFGDSKVVDNDGRPMVVYHSGFFDETVDGVPRITAEGFHFGTKAAAEQRDIGKRIDDFVKNGNVYQDESTGEWFWESDGIDSSELDEEGYSSQAKAQTALENFAVQQDFTYEDPMPITAAYLAIKNPKRVEDQKNDWTATVAQAKAEGYDGIVYRNQYEDKGSDSYIVFRPEQIKSINNVGTFDPKNPDIRFQVARPAAPSQLTPEVRKALDKAVSPEEQKLRVEMAEGAFRKKGFAADAIDTAATLEERVRTAMSDKAATVIGKLNSAVAKGQFDFLQSRTVQALLKQAEAGSQLVPAFLRMGRIGIDKSTGMWKVDNISAAATQPDAKPPIEVANIIRKWGERNGYDTFDKAWERAGKLIQSGREFEFRRINQENAKAKIKDAKKLPQSMTNAEIDAFYPVYKADADLQQVMGILTTNRHHLIDRMVDVGRISRERAEIWKKASEYIPFDRLDGFAKAVETRGKTFKQGLSVNKILPEFKDDIEFTIRPVDNVLDNAFRGLGWMVKEVVRTDAANKTIAALVRIGQAKVIGLQPPADKNRTPHVSGYHRGAEVFFEVPTFHHMAAFDVRITPLAGVFELMGKFSRALRSSITLLPTFTAAQLPQDIQRAIIYSGVQNPAALTARTLATFPKLVSAALQSKLSFATPELSRLGIAADVDFRSDDPADSILKEMGFSSYTALKSKKLGGLIHRLSEVARAGDLAVRQAIYDQTIAETQDEQLAAVRAREIINFRTYGKGDSLGILPILIQTVPFTHSYIQSTDILYRALRSKGAVSGLAKQQAKKQLMRTASMVLVGSTLYALAMAGDEEYENMDEQKRDRTWVLGKGIGIPVPSELGILFKAIPERLREYIQRSGTPTEVSAMEAISSWFRAALTAYSVDNTRMPAAVVPLLEVMTNRSFFTGRPLIGPGQEKLDPEVQAGPMTSELSKLIAKHAASLGAEISPINIDHVLRGYFGTTAVMGLAVLDAALNPDRMDRALYQMPGLAAFTYDPVGRRNLTEFYDVQRKISRMQATYNSLIKRDINAAVAYVEKNAEQMAFYKAINGTLAQLQRTRAYRTYLNSKMAAETMSPEQRRKEFDESRKLDNEIVKWIKEARPMMKL